MHVDRIVAVLLAWPLVVAALFRAAGPARAVLVGVVGGFLLLPSHQVKLGVLGFGFPVDKCNVGGLGLLLGAALFGRRDVARARPSWFDLPMAAYYLAPLAGLLPGVAGSSIDILDAMIGRGLGWFVPYVMARVYFSRDDGPAEVAAALVVGGVAYVPVCVYEQLAGPQNYLAQVAYGIPASFNSDRLGGWRPNGFLGDGLTLATWMALTAVTATWLWLGDRGRRRWAVGAVALALVLTTISCRGVYGYLILAAGLATAFLSHLTRPRPWLALLLAVPVAYMAARVSGAWDGADLVRAAGFTGRSGTVGWRLEAENEVIRRVVGERPAFGFGSYIWNASLPKWPDGAWLHALWMGGLTGLALWAGALFVVPAGMAMRPTRGDRPAAPVWALACWCGLQLLDSLHNTCYIPPLALVAGTLVGSGVIRRAPKSSAGVRSWESFLADDRPGRR